MVEGSLVRARLDRSLYCHIVFLDKNFTPQGLSESSRIGQSSMGYTSILSREGEAILCYRNKVNLLPFGAPRLEARHNFFFYVHMLCDRNRYIVTT